jgi:hypothetical protein
VACLFQKKVPDHGEKITAAIGNVAVLGRPKARVGLLHEIVNVVGVQGTDVSSQPAAYLAFVGKDVTGYPVVSGRIVQKLLLVSRVQTTALMKMNEPCFSLPRVGFPATLARETRILGGWHYIGQLGNGRVAPALNQPTFRRSVL